MPKKHPSIQFSLPSVIHEQLEAFAQEGESINLVVKRIFYQGLEALTETPNSKKPVETDWRIKIEKAIAQFGINLDRVVERIEALEQGQPQPVANLGSFLHDLVEQTEGEPESKTTAVEKVIENSPQSSTTENLEIPSILRSLHGIVLVNDQKVCKFWNGRQFVDHPGKIKIFKRSPNEKTMKAAENRVIPGTGDARTNDLASILKHIGHPYRFEGWDTKAIAKLWADKNLIHD